MNSFPSTQAVEACQTWIGMSLPGSSAECSGESDGFVAGLGNTDTSLSPDHLAMLAWKSVLEASNHDCSGGETIYQLTLIDKSCCMVSLLVFGTMMMMTCMLIFDSRVAKASQVCNLLQQICSFGQLCIFGAFMLHAQECLRAVKLRHFSCDVLLFAAEDNISLPSLQVQRFDGGKCQCLHRN